MDFVQERWQPLHLVDDDPGAAFLAAKLLAEPLRLAQVRVKHPFIEQVDTRGVREPLSSPGALSHAPDPEEEEAVRRRPQAPRIVTVYHGVIFTGNMTPWQSGGTPDTR